MIQSILDTGFYTQYVQRGYAKASPVPKIMNSMQVISMWGNGDVPYVLAIASFLAYGKIREHGDVLTPRQLQNVRNILTDCGEDEEMIGSVLRILSGSSDCSETERNCYFVLVDTTLYQHIINNFPYTEWTGQADRLRTSEVRQHLMSYAEKKRLEPEGTPKPKKGTGVIRPKSVEKTCRRLLKWEAGCTQEPAVLWQNLKKFAARPIDADEDDWLWEVYREGSAYRVAFVRQYSQPEEDEYIQLHIVCRISPDTSLPEETLWSFDCPDRETFFTRIEQSPAFQVFLAETSVSPEIYTDET